MRKLSLMTIFATWTPLALAASYVIQPDKSSLSFVYRAMGAPIEGRFKRFSARIDFDPARPQDAKASMDVDTASIDTGMSEADREVAGKNWFDVKTFPQATFVATAVKPLGGNRFQASGKMTIRGHAQDVTAPFVFTQEDSGAIFEGSFVIKRADYGIGGGEWGDFGTVANEVQLKFRLRGDAK